MWADGCAGKDRQELAARTALEEIQPILQRLQKLSAAHAPRSLSLQPPSITSQAPGADPTSDERLTSTLCELMFMPEWTTVQLITLSPKKALTQTELRRQVGIWVQMLVRDLDALAFSVVDTSIACSIPLQLSAGEEFRDLMVAQVLSCYAVLCCCWGVLYRGVVCAVLWCMMC